MWTFAAMTRDLARVRFSRCLLARQGGKGRDLSGCVQQNLILPFAAIPYFISAMCLDSLAHDYFG